MAITSPYAAPYDPNAPVRQPMFPRGLQQGLGNMWQGFQRGSQALNPYSNRLLGFGAGMLSGGGLAAGARGLMAGSALDKESADERRLKKAIAGLRADTSGPLGELPESYWNFLEAADPSVTGKILADRMSPPSAGVTVYAGDYKVPPGYRPADPDNPDAGVEPIPGGPAEQVPGDLAARIGLTNAFLEKAPAIKKRLQSGEATGIWDRARAGWDDASTQADLYRQLESGSDALRRMLTGAGMQEGEAATYSRRYLPSYTDDATSVGKKLDGLVDELEHMKEAAMRGRGGADAATGSDRLELF